MLSAMTYKSRHRATLSMEEDTPRKYLKQNKAGVGSLSIWTQRVLHPTNQEP